MQFSLEAKTCDSPKFHSLPHWNGAAKQSRILSTWVVNHKLPTHSRHIKKRTFSFFFCYRPRLSFSMGRSWSLSQRPNHKANNSECSFLLQQPFFFRWRHKRSRPNQGTFCKILTAPPRQIPPPSSCLIQEEEEQQSVFFPPEIFYSFGPAICRFFFIRVYSIYWTRAYHKRKTTQISRISKFRAKMPPP